MKILALDVGAGTLDILFYDENNSENSIKMVLPSPTKVYGWMVEEATKQKLDLYIKGDIIGGSGLKNPIQNHLKKGFKVWMTKNAAYSLRNHLDEVEAWGIKIVEDEKIIPEKSKILELRDVNLKILGDFLLNFGVKVSDVEVVAVAVQDSGVAPKGMENRRFRLLKIREILESNPKIENLAFKDVEIPPVFLRMKNVAQTVKTQLPQTKILVMDTAPAAILGCLKDPKMEEAKNVLAVNVGNAHTLIALIKNEEICGMVEHHTRMLKLKPEKIGWLIKEFLTGKLTDENVRLDGGHGLFYLQNFKPQTLEKTKIVVTGPNRKIFCKTNLKFDFATPLGDVMMTGTIGLVEAAKRKF